MKCGGEKGLVEARSRGGLALFAKIGFPFSFSGSTFDHQHEGARTSEEDEEEGPELDLGVHWLGSSTDVAFGGRGSGGKPGLEGARGRGSELLGPCLGNVGV